MRSFSSGATRDTDNLKLDFEGALSPIVLMRYAEYMRGNRKRPDGTVRADDNWQLGIPLTSYMKSGCRHFMDVWILHRTGITAGLEDAICALLFNMMGYLHSLLVKRGYVPVANKE